MVKAKKFLYVKRFDGEPKITDFELVEEELPDIKDGEYLAEALYHSIDPYQRKYMIRHPVGVTMIGGQIAKIIESKAKAFPVGSIVYGHFGWRTHTIVDATIPPSDSFYPYILPSFGALPLSLGLGALGRTGMSAYFGFLKLCRPQPGETVVVSGAAGAVGSLVGQIGKIMGCTVIGIAGNDAKCDWLTKTLGFDYAINYKTDEVARKLKEFAPDGIDCYFDNVGGELSSIVIGAMCLFGRIAVCGSVSTYNADEEPLVRQFLGDFVAKQLSMEGFLTARFVDIWTEGVEQMRQWVLDGRIKYGETITVGFENMPQALIGMLRGDNTGKAIVKTSL